MTIPPSLRFYWCSGCGRWHDPRNDSGTHHLMCVPRQDPGPGNFDGTPEELARFVAGNKLSREDAAAFERRIDDALKEKP